MNWRVLMKAETQAEPAFPDLQKRSTKYTKPCRQVRPRPVWSNFVDCVDEIQESEIAQPLGVLKPGTFVRYKIPRILTPIRYEWEWHEGTVDLINEETCRVLVIPDTEEGPWRWVSTCYVQSKGND